MGRSAILSLLLALCMAGCAAEPPVPAAEQETDESEAFQDDIRSDLDKVDIFLDKTRHGINLSEFTLGWFAMILLNELSNQDEVLKVHVHPDGGTVESYLRTAFQGNPQGEIAAMGALTPEGRAAVRLSARLVLEMLTVIPDGNDPPEVQAATRRKLMETLDRLKAGLSGVLAEAPPPDAARP